MRLLHRSKQIPCSSSSRTLSVCVAFVRLRILLLLFGVLPPPNPRPIPSSRRPRKCSCLLQEDPALAGLYPGHRKLSSSDYPSLSRPECSLSLTTLSRERILALLLQDGLSTLP